MAREGTVSTLLDHLLELSVVGSWSSLGYRLRAGGRSWAPNPKPRRGRHVLITGGTSGIGRAAALLWARRGARVGIVGRDAGRARRVAEDLTVSSELSGSSPVWSAEADLADLVQVRRLAAEVRQWSGGDLGVVLHCAGALLRDWHEGPSGIERTLASHVVGPHLLTSELQGLLRNPGSAVVWMSSGGMYTQPLRLESLELPPEHYRGTVAYARAKRAQVVLAELWDKQLRSGVRSFAMHPGWVNTDALHDGLPLFARTARPLLRTPAQGADTAVWLGDGGAPVGAPSAFWLDRRPRAVSRWPGPRVREGESAALWEWCQRHAGVEHRLAPS